MSAQRNATLLAVAILMSCSDDDGASSSCGDYLEAVDATCSLDEEQREDERTKCANHEEALPSGCVPRWRIYVACVVSENEDSCAGLLGSVSECNQELKDLVTCTESGMGGSGGGTAGSGGRGGSGGTAGTGGSGGTSGIPDPYGKCSSAADCLVPDSRCPGSTSTCGPPCTTVEDCPSPVSGLNQLSCTGGVCSITCSMTDPCPVGMKCIAGIACGW